MSLTANEIALETRELIGRPAGTSSSNGDPVGISNVTVDVVVVGLMALAGDLYEPTVNTTKASKAWVGFFMSQKDRIRFDVIESCYVPPKASREHLFVYR